MTDRPADRTPPQPNTDIQRPPLTDQGDGPHGSASLTLYTCAAQKHGATAPLIRHPCGVAAKALDEAGLGYQIRVVGGFKNVPFSRRGKREEIIRLTGQADVPVLADEGHLIAAGSQAIVAWARSRSA